VAAIRNAIIIGGGFSGMAAAIQLRKADVDTTLVEVDPHWRPIGAGITMGGATLRALFQLGVYDEFAKHGATAGTVDACAPDGTKIFEIPNLPAIGTNLPGMGGIMRPVLARILADATRAAGVNVKLGATYSAIEPDATGVNVTLTDGTSARYDLLIGADGVNSQLRARFFPEVKPPQYIGQGVWRAVVKRPTALARPRIWFGKHIKMGVNPVSATHGYMFITEDRETKQHIDPTTWVDVFTGLMRPFPDPMVQGMIPEIQRPEAAIDYRPLANLLVPMPWNRGRVVLIGDTVAATTPHLASGACIGIESGIVLGEELGNCADLQTALDHFHARRWERCRLVVENSARLAQIEIEGGDKDEHGRIMRESSMALRAPI
jgi:2-polyprenyl-6-methoxyphenol hydroxylase-like FAD-dependent oxidoreductase